MTLVEQAIGIGATIAIVLGVAATGIGILMIIDRWDTIVFRLKAANPFRRSGPSEETIQPVDTDDKIYGKVGDNGIVEGDGRPEKPDLHAGVKEQDSTLNVTPDDTGVETNDYGLSEMRAETIRLEPDGTFQILRGSLTIGNGQIETDEIRDEQLQALMSHAGVHNIELTAPRRAYNFEDHGSRVL